MILLETIRTIIKLPRANQEITFELAVVELVNTKLEKPMTGLQRNQFKNIAE